jgi:hypothetical protein
MLEMGDFNWKVCDYRRYHDVYTCLMSGLRRFISYKGVPLVNIDICNSQPFILGSLILSGYFGPAGSSDPSDRPTHLKAGVSLSQISVRLDEDDGSSPEEEGGDETPVPIRRQRGGVNDRNSLVDSEDATRGKTPESDDAGGSEDGCPRMPDAPDDLIEYITLCQQGRLYEYLMERTGHTDKRRFKDDLWFHFLYGSNKELDRCKADPHLRHLVPLIELFQTEFPTVYEYMWRAKLRNYRKLPCEMQRLEARIMIDTVVGWLAENMPEAPLLTIHDSVLTTPEYVPLVERLIGVAFEAHGFLKPTLNVELPLASEMSVAA